MKSAYVDFFFGCTDDCFACFAGFGGSTLDVTTAGPDGVDTGFFVSSL